MSKFSLFPLPTNVVHESIVIVHDNNNIIIQTTKCSCRSCTAVTVSLPFATTAGAGDASAFVAVAAVFVAVAVAVAAAAAVAAAVAAEAAAASESDQPFIHPSFSMLTQNAHFLTRPKLCLTVSYMKSRPAVCPHPCPLVLPLTFLKKYVFAIVAYFLLSFHLLLTASPGLANTDLLPSLFYTSPSCFAHSIQCSPKLPILSPSPICV